MTLRIDRAQARIRLSGEFRSEHLDQDEIRGMGVIPVAAPLLKRTEVKARHDSVTLARLVLALARGMVGTRDVICSQENGR